MVESWNVVGVVVRGGAGGGWGMPIVTGTIPETTFVDVLPYKRFSISLKI